MVEAMMAEEKRALATVGQMDVLAEVLAEKADRIGMPGLEHAVTILQRELRWTREALRRAGEEVA